MMYFLSCYSENPKFHLCPSLHFSSPALLLVYPYSFPRYLSCFHTLTIFQIVIMYAMNIDESSIKMTQVHTRSNLLC